MKPDYTKLTISLTIALGLVGDGELLSVLVNQEEGRQLTKSEIFELSLHDDVREIDIERRILVRRWHERYLNRDRRNE